MPVHRLQGPLADAIAGIEANGEKIVQVILIGGEWEIITERKPKVGRPRKETR